MSSFLNVSLAVGLGVLSISAMVACSPSDPTQIVAGMVTQMQVPEEIKSVGVTVNAGGRQMFCNDYVVADGSVTLPSTLGSTPRDELGLPITVTVLGFKKAHTNFADTCLPPDVGEDGAVVLRRRRTTYVENHALYLPMPIRQACTDVVCPDDHTCLGGVCEPMDVDSSTLEDFDERFVFGRWNTCFNVSECVPAMGSMPARLVDSETCEFELDVPEGIPIPPNAALNVRVVHQNFTPEVLDVDEKEGFIPLAESGSHRFRLASNLCASRFNTGKMMGVSATLACPSKTPLQPICEGDQQAIVDGSSSPYGPAICVHEERLIPTESALYILMDRSRSMKHYFGEDGLQKVLSVSLEDPIFERTRVAFNFIPAKVDDCSDHPNAYGLLTGPDAVTFLPARETQTQIAGLIADKSKALGDDPPLFLDAAMSFDGAYGALKDLVPMENNKSFNRRALLILGNRDFISRCASGQEPATLAENALNDEIHTYVVALSAPSETDQGGRDPIADAKTIATAGGTSVFDASVNSDVGASAMQTVVTDLGSCLYDPPDGLGSDVEAQKVTYLDPTTLSRQSISYDGRCSENEGSASGWAVDDEGRVRICGSACESLRNSIKTSSTIAATRGHKAPMLSLFLTRSCDS